MLCYGDIFLLSHSNKNIITCQKINKLFRFLCITIFLYSVFYNITHSQHVDLLRSGPGNKETFNPSSAHLPYTEAVTK